MNLYQALSLSRFDSAARTEPWGRMVFAFREKGYIYYYRTKDKDKGPLKSWTPTSSNDPSKYQDWLPVAPHGKEL